MTDVTITPEATYWFRSIEVKWYKTTKSVAESIYSAPAGAPVKVSRGKRTYEVSVLAVMPAGYQSKSDVQRGLGVVLWTWDFGAKSCDEIKKSIERWVEDDVRKAEIYGREVPRYVYQYRALVEQLCPPRAVGGYDFSNNPASSTKSLKNKLLR